MSKSSPRKGFGRSSVGTVTVIEAKVHRSSARNALVAFYLTAIIVGLLSMVVASDYMHPILAMLLGAFVGALTGGIVWVLVRVWPIIRLIWWWLPEILIASLLLWSWIKLAVVTPAWATALVVAILVGVPAIFRPLRERVVALAWCLIVRHRLRVCFSQFIQANKSGSLPLILWARPTPVGERVWAYLRPGMSLRDLQGRLDKIAVVCHAASVTVERASTGNAAFLRFDTKRREVLNATIGSPLVDLIDEDAPIVQPYTEIPTGLDLPDVPDEPVTMSAPATKSASSVNGRKPTPATPSAAGDSSEGDINDWI